MSVNSFNAFCNHIINSPQGTVSTSQGWEIDYECSVDGDRITFNKIVLNHEDLCEPTEIYNEDREKPVFDHALSTMVDDYEVQDCFMEVFVGPFSTLMEEMF